MLLDALHKIANHRTSLTREEAREVMSQILRGEATDAQIAALLVALHMKGETVEEIVGFAQAIRAEAAPLQTEDGEALDLSGTERDALVDTCGTGGDASGTFNISTATALAIAGRWSASRETRQPQHQLQVRLGRRDGGARRQHQSATGAHCCLPARDRHRISVCSSDAFGHEVRATGAPPVAVAHRV